MDLSGLDLDHLSAVAITALPSVVAILIAALFLHFLVKRLLVLLARRTHFTPTELSPIHRAFKWTIVIGSLVLALSTFGINLGGIWGMLSTVLAMIAIGFVAVWSVLSNTLCTLIIMIFRPFSIGDEVEFPGEPVKGRVTDLNLIYTTLDSGDGTLLQVPNNLFFQKVVRRRKLGAAVPLATHLRAKPPLAAETAA